MFNYLSKQMIEIYHQKILEKNKRVLKIIQMVIFGLLFCAISLFLLYSAEVIDNLDVFYVLLGFLICMIIVWILIRQLFVSEKPLYTYLYPILLEDIRYSEDIEIEYKDYPKIKEILHDSYLFTKYASSQTRASLILSNTSHQITIYDTFYYTNTNNSTITHFNGYYIVIEGIAGKDIQVRTKGRPSRSDFTYIKTHDEKRIKVFCEDPLALSNARIMKIFEFLNERLQPKNLFLSVVKDRLFISVDLLKQTRSIRQLDQHSYVLLRDKIINLTNSINEAILLFED